MKKKHFMTFSLEGVKYIYGEDEEFLAFESERDCRLVCIAMNLATDIQFAFNPVLLTSEELEKVIGGLPYRVVDIFCGTKRFFGAPCDLSLIMEGG